MLKVSHAPISVACLLSMTLLSGLAVSDLQHRKFKRFPLGGGHFERRFERV